MKITPIQLAKRVEVWQKRLALLGVAHFTIRQITLGDECPWGTSGRRVRASVYVPPHYDYCDFFFHGPEVEEMSEDELDQTIVHEWIHVAMRDLDEALDSVEDYMSAASYGEWEGRIDHEREGLVDRLAMTIVATHLGRRPIIHTH